MRRKRNTCKNRKRTSVATTNSRRNQFDALTSIQEELEETEMNCVEEVQETVEITVVSGAATSVWPIQKSGVVRSKSKKEVKLAAGSGSAMRVEGDEKLELMREGKKCCMKFLDADPSARSWTEEARSSLVSKDSTFGNVSTGQRIPMSRRKGVFVVQLNTAPGSKAKEKASVFKRPA